MDLVGLLSTFERAGTRGPNSREPQPRTQPGRAPRRSQLSRLQIAELVQRYVAAESANDLAAAYGIHPTTVLGHLKRRGIGRRPNHCRLTDAEVQRAAPLYRAGATLDEVGARFGVTGTTMRKELAKLGVEIRRGGPQTV